MINYVSLCVYSHDAEKLADFYAKVFNCTVKECDSIFYECTFTRGFKIRIYPSEIKHEPIEIDFFVWNIDKVFRSISECYIIKQLNANEKSFTAKDLDGNRMNIKRESRLTGVGMPILGN